LELVLKLATLQRVVLAARVSESSLTSALQQVVPAARVSESSLTSALQQVVLAARVSESSLTSALQPHSSVWGHLPTAVAKALSSTRVLARQRVATALELPPQVATAADDRRKEPA
jgi:hypothetical protein